MLDLSEVMSLNIGCQTFYHLKTGSFHDSIIDIVIFFYIIIIVARIIQEIEIILDRSVSLLSFQCEWCVLFTGFKRNRTFFFSFFLFFIAWCSVTCAWCFYHKQSTFS